MPPVAKVESGVYRPYTKTAGVEPLSGYRLLEPLGRGGFGEVWKCEAPGGLLKAIKFVPGASAEDGNGEARLGQELDAFEQIKLIRHPFLLTLERVEIIRGELVMVMELADRQLNDRYRECRTCGLPGIPRDELLAYFADAAEALDMISAKYGLQHLDVKPANLFLVAGHVKVGDYGLVARLDPDGVKSGNRGLTPKYVSPEALRSQPSAQSDQYSLALVYQELLTGTFPYAGRTPQQLMLQHVSAKPDLSGLPLVDQTIVAQALAKNPKERFGSCLAFIQSLMAVASAASLPGAGMEVRRARVERSMADMNLPTAEPVDAADSTGGRLLSEATQNFTLPGVMGVTAPGRPGSQLPKLVPTRRQPSSASSSVATPAPISSYIEPSGPPVRRFAVVLDPIKSIVPVARLIGMDSGDLTLSPTDFIRSVVEHAAGGAHFPQMPGDLGQLADGTWVCQFPSTVPSAVVPLKLAVLREQWKITIDQPDSAHLVLKRTCAGGLWGSFSGKKSGFEVIIRLPNTGRAVGEIVVTGSLFGTPDREFARQTTDLIPQLISQVRRELKNVEDRRRHPRLTANFMVTLYPIHGDGGIDVAVHARCRDVSMGGLCVATDTPLSTKYSYASFDGVSPTAGQAILVRFLRSQPVNREVLSGGQYRTDL
jgi:eukaryotic-like serine/threonine-protein kinase